MTSKLLQALKERPLLGDGAMGTQLMAAGLQQGECGESWNLEHPERVIKIQRAYVEAGSDILISNTFGGCRLTLAQHGIGEKAAEISRAAVKVAREAFGDKPGFVLGDIGPFGGIMEPFGDTPEEDVREAFGEQAKALVEAGADAVIVETMASLEELGIGIEAAKAAGAPCVIGSMAFDISPDQSSFRTMMGVDPAGAAAFMAEAGADIVAFNCGTGMTMPRALDIVKRYREACDLPIMAQPNAGLPVIEQGETIFKETPEEMVQGVPALLEAGANIVGGCCGSSPAHIAAFRKAIDEFIAKGGAA